MFSGGVTSWAAAKRVADQYGTDDLALLFADTLIEDEDLYRFLDEAAANVGGELIRIAEGRTPFEVFRDVRFLGNTRVDPCSRILKRDLMAAWMDANRDPADTLIAYGFDALEGHRMDRLTSRADDPWRRWAPLLEPPYLPKARLIDWLKAEGVEPPRLYGLGFSHNNCGGGCVKAGQAAWAKLLRVMPDRYAKWEADEDAFRKDIAPAASILRDRRGGTTRPMPLKEFRERTQSGVEFDKDDWGSCGCFQVAEGVQQGVLL